MNIDNVKNTIKDNWKQGVKVSFLKKDGSLREMIVKLNEEMLQPKSELSAGTLSRRETNKARNNLVVTEYLPETETYQIRTIPLKNVQTIQLIG